MNNNMNDKHASVVKSCGQPQPVAVGSTGGSAILGTLTRSGTFPIREEDTTGFVVSCTSDDLASARFLPMYRRVAIITAEELQALVNDRERLDWLADRENKIGNVQLPRECVENNLTSMRGAIDQARPLSTALPNTEGSRARERE